MAHIFTLHEAGYRRKYIVEFLGVTLGQVAYTLRSGHLSPKKNKSASPKPSTMHVDESEAFVCSSHETRQMSYLDLAPNFPNWNVGEGAIKNALIKRRYSRYLSRNKPQLSEENKRIRKAWAEAHLHYSQEDWSLILRAIKLRSMMGRLHPNLSRERSAS